MLELSEPVNVWVFFKGVTITPYVFFWRNRKIKIDSINLVHTTRVDGSDVHHFSVSAEGNFYRLAFDLRRLKWLIEAVEE